jgi:predicted CopG family antitoxin
MKTIPLTNSDKVVMVDDEDYEELVKYKWSLNKSSNNESVLRYFTKDKIELCVRMVSLIFPPSKGKRVNCIDGNTINLQKSNLRYCTTQQSTWAMRKKRSGQGSKYKGVTFDTKRNKYRANIKYNYKDYFLGRYGCEEDAARAYNKRALEYFGEYARLNVIPTDIQTEHTIIQQSMRHQAEKVFNSTK